jgi:DME family drug/metabolite transporter
MTDALTHLRPDLTHLRAYGLVLLAGGLWSLGGIIVREIEVASEWQLLFYRSVTLAVTLFAFLAARSRGHVMRTFQAAGVAGIAAGLCLAASFICFIFSVTHTTVANTLFLLSSAPFISAALGRILLSERLRSTIWAIMSVEFIGIALMVWEGLGAGDLFGDLTALGAALGFSGFTVALRHGKTVEMLPAICLAGTFGALVAGTITIPLGNGLVIPVHDLLLCVIYGGAVLGFGLIMYTAGSRYVPAAELTLLSLTEVVLGPIWVWLVIGEAPSGMTLLGGVVLLGAITGLAISGTQNGDEIG